MVTAYIGIGSNIGDRQTNINKAIAHLRNSENIKVIKVSSIYETEPMSGPLQPNYLNGVIEIETDFSPLDLLKHLNEIEIKLGRVRSVKFGPRIIDLDILLYGDMEINDEHLTIPHPRMHERDFVLRGLREVTKAY